MTDNVPVPREVLENPAFVPLLGIGDSVILTNREVARHHGLSARRLQSMRISGRGPSFLEFGVTRYPLSELLFWERNASVGPIKFEPVKSCQHGARPSRRLWRLFSEWATGIQGLVDCWPGDGFTPYPSRRTTGVKSATSSPRATKRVVPATAPRPAST